MKPAGTSAPAIRGWLPLVLVIGAILRIGYAVVATGLFHPDEIHQSLEPAHGVIFGVGVRSWEFLTGARPWTTPGVFVALLGALKAVGLTAPDRYLLVVRLFDALIACTWPWLCFRMGRALRSPRAGLIAATLVATWYFFVLLAPRALNHTFSITFVLWALARVLENRDSRRALFATGMLFGLAFAFRYQDGLVGLGAVLFLFSERRGREVPLFLAGAALPALGVGLLDAITWGVPFHSLFAYLQANVIEGAAGRFGAMPAWFYLWHVPAALGWGALWLLLVPLVGRRAGRLLVTVGVVVLVAHSLTANKQLRFILPTLLVLMCALGCAADALIERTNKRIVGAALLGAWVLASAHAAWGLTFARLGIFTGQPETVESPWSFRRDLNRALIKLGRREDVCGLVVYPYGGAAGPARIVTTGGYTHLHRPVPLTMGPLTDEAAPFTSHALFCPDSQGRLMTLPDFAPLGRVGTCVVAQRTNFRCDNEAATRRIQSVRW
jgi:hypothetical protein